MLLWRLGDDSAGLWKEIIISKYGASRGGWEVCGGTHHLSGIWKGVLSDFFIFNPFVTM